MKKLNFLKFFKKIFGFFPSSFFDFFVENFFEIFFWIFFFDFFENFWEFNFWNNAHISLRRDPQDTFRSSWWTGYHFLCAEMRFGSLTWSKVFQLLRFFPKFILSVRVYETTGWEWQILARISSRFFRHFTVTRVRSI